MEESRSGIGLFFISLSLLFFTAVLTFISLQQFRSVKPVLPDGSMVAGIPVAGLSPDEAADRVRSVYGLPVMLDYLGSRICLGIPDSVDYEALKAGLTDRMRAVYTSNSFMDYLAGKFSQEAIVMEPVFNELPDSVRSFLEDEIVPRYDIFPMSVQPEGSIFRAGHGGRKLDIDAALPLIDAARRSGTDRTAVLPVTPLDEPAGDLRNLAVMLRAVIDTWQDSGQVTEVWLSDPVSGQNFDIARRSREDLTPEIAFTAASTMKLPIMISS